MEMPTVASAIARPFIGGALQPVDYQRGLMSRYYELQDKQRKLRLDYNRALQANDKSLADSLLRQWVGVMKQMFAYKMPIGKGTERMLQGAGVPRQGPP